MDSEYIDILHRCFRCGWCKLPTNYTDFNCPAYLQHRFESFSSGGRMWLIRAWVNGEIESSERFSEIMFSCVTCGNCVEACPMDKIKDRLVDVFISARADLVEQGKIPPALRDYFKAVTISGNPYKRPREERRLWAGGLDLEEYSDQEYLFYIGDVASYDEPGMRSARAIVQLLNEAGVSFGVLMDQEGNDGNDVRAAGETSLADHLARSNCEVFNQKGVKKIITVSPHAYNTIRKDYPAHGGNFEVFHYTEVLSLLIKKGLDAGRSSAKVTYHDPCYLGRWNKIYYPPRAIIGSIKGVTFKEMDRNMNNALCCAGGGGNFFTDILGTGPGLSSRVRVREAIATGADILCVACPQCYRMLDDALKAEAAEDRLRVMDIAELFVQSRK